MKNKYIHSILPLFYVLIMMFLTWTLLFNIPIINISWLWLLVGCGISFFTIRTYFRSNIFNCIAIYAFFVITNVFLGDFYFNSLPLACNEIASLVFVSSALCYFLHNKTNKYYNWFLLTFFLIIVYTAYASYRIDLIDPGAIRDVTVSGFGGDSTLIRLFYARGMGSYTMTHALPVIIPPLVMGIRFSNLRAVYKVLILCSLVATVIYIYLGYASGALIISLLSLILSLVISPGSMESNIGKVVVVSIILLPFLNNNFLLFILGAFDDFIGNEGAYHVKVEEFQMLLTSGEYGEDITARSDLYTDSVSNFFQNIILGTNGEIGGHSALLDRFATLGILGVIPFMLFLIRQIKYPIRFINPKYVVFYYVGAFSGLLMLLTKNMGNWEMWLCLFLVLPMMMVKLSPNTSLHIKKSIAMLETKDN